MLPYIKQEAMNPFTVSEMFHSLYPKDQAVRASTIKFHHIQPLTSKRRGNSQYTSSSSGLSQKLCF